MKLREILLGLGLACLTALFLAALPEAWARGAVSNLLTLIAAIYVGFSLASQGRLRPAKQVLGCGFLVALALIGLWLSWWFLVVGLALHGGWDFWHHGERGRGVVPGWYVSFCAVYDWALSVFVTLYFVL